MKKTKVEIHEDIKYSDVTRGIVWPASEYDFITKKYAAIRKLDERGNISAKHKAIEELEAKLWRSINDQTAIDEQTGKRYEPLDHTVKHDLITNAGRERLAELATRESNQTFDYMAIGIGQKPPEDDDRFLVSEVTRVSSRATGYVSAGGAVIKHSAIFSPGEDTNTFWEVAPVDTVEISEDQFAFARVVFDEDKPLNHTFNADFFSISHFVYTTSSR